MRFIFSCFIILISVVLYGTFGYLCAVGYKALDSNCKQTTMRSSPLLKRFIDNTNEKQATFSIDEIQDGIIHIVIKNASEKAKIGDSVVLPSLPIVEFDDDKNGLSIAIPVYINTFLGNVGSRVIFEFSIKGKLNFENLRIGDAKIPSFFHKYISQMVLVSYSDVSSDYLEKFSNLNVKKLGKEFVLSK